MEDIVNRRCDVAGCKTRPMFGKPEDDSPTRCSTHKEEGMEDIKSRRCSVDGG